MPRWWSKHKVDRPYDQSNFDYLILPMDYESTAVISLTCPKNYTYHVLSLHGLYQAGGVGFTTYAYWQTRSGDNIILVGRSAGRMLGNMQYYVSAFHGAHEITPVLTYGEALNLPLPPLLFLRPGDYIRLASWVSQVGWFWRSNYSYATVRAWKLY